MYVVEAYHSDGCCGELIKIEAESRSGPCGYTLNTHNNNIVMLANMRQVLSPIAVALTWPRLNAVQICLETKTW